ncbi:hypothetical protein, partial [Stenotrophomonas maltophilia]|uniref:hypothetical protein n=1 Tax=Stenotrophomonas maltophilia TaxID=40324 RepID=UPI00195421C7
TGGLSEVMIRTSPWRVVVMGEVMFVSSYGFTRWRGEKKFDSRGGAEKEEELVRAKVPRGCAPGNGPGRVSGGWTTAIWKAAVAAEGHLRV